MKRLITSFGVFCLSLVLAYASVAWAFNPCNADAETLDLAPSVTRNLDMEPLSQELGARSADESRSVEIHCAETDYEFDIAAATSTTASLIRYRKLFHTHPFLPQESPASLENRTIVKSSHVIGFSSISPPEVVSRQVFFSVFLI
jgi:hypothetical protein